MKARRAGPAATSDTHHLPLRSVMSTSHGRGPHGAASSGQPSGHAAPSHASLQHA